MSKWFLSLDDAVAVASREFEIDAELASNEFFQKCYVSDNQYDIGYQDGLADAIARIEKLKEGAEN